MKTTHTRCLLAGALLFALAACQSPTPAPAETTGTANTVSAVIDPLSSWNDGTKKSAIIDFVKRTTTVFELVDGLPTLTKTIENAFMNDKAGKPEGIHLHIGRRPIFCAGNSDGDQAMLEYTTIGNPRPSFGMIIHHTDSVRETAYDTKPPVSGTLITAKDAAPERGWMVVDMEKDWKSIFPE